MFKFIRITLLRWRISLLKSELDDFQSLMILRSHHFHNQEFINTDLHFRFKRRLLSRIMRLKRKVIQIKNA